ncbi:MAG: hypothetical protein HC770_04620 [Pseudanabaena sp. CRU_2_10]|nr:hypothetical protein [Pseudanabaena sp. CRU_2_10]
MPIASTSHRKQKTAPAANSSEPPDLDPDASNNSDREDSEVGSDRNINDRSDSLQDAYGRETGDPDAIPVDPIPEPPSAIAGKCGLI